MNYIISFPISGENNIINMLNILCNKNNIWGESKKASNTFIDVKLLLTYKKAICFSWFVNQLSEVKSLILKVSLLSGSRLTFKVKVFAYLIREGGPFGN